MAYTLKHIPFLCENIPLQVYAEDTLVITEWKQRGEYIKPDIKFAAPDANDFSSLSINLSENFFKRFSGKGRTPKGNIVNFIMNVHDVDKETAQNILLDYANLYFSDLADRKSIVARAKKPVAVKIDKDFKLPLPYSNNNRVIEYLLDCRKLNKEVVFYLIKNNYLYQSIDGKCVFVSYENDTPVFGCVRDTNWNKRITYGVKNSKIENGWFLKGDINRQPSNKLVVTEGVLDVLSFASLVDLQGKEFDFLQYNLLALTGCEKLMCIEYQLKQNPHINELYLAFDNDEAGNIALNKTKEMLKEIHYSGKVHIVKIKHGKDLNEELKFRKKQNLV